jgi:hypothetical protein
MHFAVAARNPQPELLSKAKQSRAPLKSKLFLASKPETLEIIPDTVFCETISVAYTWCLIPNI